MAKEKYAVLWLESDAAGTTDLLPAEWFRSECKTRNRVHFVRGIKGRLYQAKCDIVVRKKSADLDYEAHALFNVKHEMAPGIMRLEFEDDSRATIAQVLWKAEGNRSNRFVPCKTSIELEGAAEVPDVDSGVEGFKNRVQHLACERAVALVKKKKQHVLDETGKLVCEACHFDFSKTFPDIGSAFCEVHHRVELSKTGKKITKLGELAILCSNCHRMIHRTGDPMMSVEKFAEKYFGPI